MEGLSKVEVPGTRPAQPEHARGASGASGASGTRGASGSEPKALLGATHPHAPGARMTVVKLTPSNDNES